MAVAALLAALLVGTEPSVQIVSPAAGASYFAPATIRVWARSTGPATRVDFYLGGRRIAAVPRAADEGADEPWATVTGVRAGSYDLFVRAVTNGGSVESAHVPITVVERSRSAGQILELLKEEQMGNSIYPVAVIADQAPGRARQTGYPEPFASRMAGRRKHPLADLFGITNFGVNLTRLAPGASSALRHAHSKQDEFAYVLQGNPTLHTNEGISRLAPGMCAGFRAGGGNAHRLVNDTAEEVVYLEIGDRTPGDEGTYPDDDLMTVFTGGRWNYLHKDGTPW